MKEIQGDATNIRSLLANKKFSIDYYQREYRWERKHVAELIDDVSGAFRDNYSPDHSRADVEAYGRYFLGSVILSNENGKRFIVDGQQRLTTITLLLIHLYNSIQDDDQRAEILNLIFSRRFGKRSFNIDVEGRREVMNALLEDIRIDADETQDPSSANIEDRYNDIRDMIGDTFEDSKVIPYFVDWLTENVYFVEIVAGDDADAYTIFETMNDRGLSLTPSEMMRGYLLANISDPDARTKATKSWDSNVGQLQSRGKEEDADAIKAWLRSQYAHSIRSSGTGSEPGDFDLIGTEFHRWVRNNAEKLELGTPESFSDFILDDFAFYAEWYRRMRDASRSREPGLEPFFFVGQTNFTLHYMAALSTLRVGEAEEICKRKLSAVAAFADCMLNRRIWNRQSIQYATMRVRMFQSVMMDIRHKDIDELTETLCELLDRFDESFARYDFGLHGGNRGNVHLMLARMTDFVEMKSGRGSSSFSDYVKRYGRGSFQIEHVLSQSHRDDPGYRDFQSERNQLGGLVLLPGSPNASLGDMRYESKREHYLKHNLLASSLDDLAYSNEPGFTRFVRESGLPFRAYDEFTPEALGERQELYRQLAELIWSPESIREAAAA